jgi:predicted Zn-dependent protease with MMP-like domain
MPPFRRSALGVPAYAGRMPVEIAPEDFDRLVEAALDELPDEIAALVTNVVVQVEDDAPPEDPDLLGIYDGVALTDRAANHAGMLPDRILLFRGPLCDMCDSLDQLRDEVRITVVHEVAHHFGIGEERLHALGLG